VAGVGSSPTYYIGLGAKTLFLSNSYTKGGRVVLGCDTGLLKHE